MSSRVEALDLAIAERLRVLRLGPGGEARVRLHSVSSYLGIAFQSYQKMEAGKTSFRASTLQKLAVFFNVPVTYFYDGVGASAVPNMEEIGTVAVAMRSVDRQTAHDMVRVVLARKSASGH